MSIVRLDAVRREIGDFVILDSVSAALARGERVGLVGANGAGKTTLLRIIAGDEEPDGGRVHVARGSRVALLAQEAKLDRHFSEAPDVRAIVRRGAQQLERMELQLAEMEAAGAEAVESREYAALRERFEAADGYHLDQRVEATLSGLGVARALWDHAPEALSGGEGTRVALARQLVADPELLMLDEPTNHLDIAALEWLETTLVRREGAVLVASHDRAFLDAVAEKVWELRDRRLTVFRGAYSAYLSQREAADARARRDADTGAAAVAREEELIQRYRSQRKHVKMHEHERRRDQLLATRAEAPRRTRALHLPGHGLGSATPPRSAEVAVTLEGVLCGYRATDATAETVAVTRVDHLEARRGERIGLVGPNGAGKSTLLRTIAGELPALEGFVRIGRNVAPGYLSQLRDRPLAGPTILDALMAAAAVTPGVARSYLARFLFRGDEVEKPVAKLSGGERSRLELALLGVDATNLLLLDEPTNHLDIPAREALEAFLRETEATLIVVSHDRRLLETVCERLWVVSADSLSEDATVAPFDGSYPAWRTAIADGWTVADELVRRRGGTVARPASTAHGTTNGVNEPTRRDAGGSPRHDERGRGPARGSTTEPVLPPLSKDAYRRQSLRIEADLARLSEQKSALEAGLEDPAVHANFVELRRLTSELADVDAALVQAEEAWLTLEERAP